METKNTRLYEAILVLSAFVVYVVRRLFEASEEIDIAVHQVTQQLSMLQGTEQIDTSMYMDSTRYMLPMIGGAILLFAAWLIFHLIVCKRISTGKFDSTVFLSAALSLAFIFASLFLFHGLMEYIRYRHNEYGQIIGLRMQSLYRKKTVLGDAVGICILFVFFELVSNVFRYLQRQLLKEQEKLLVIIASFIPFIPAGILCCLALVIQLPTPLWSGVTQAELLWIGSILVVWAMQEYLIRYLIPHLKGPENVTLKRLFIFVLIWMAGNALVWSAYSNFYFYYHPAVFYHRLFLLQLIRTLFPAIVFAVFRKVFLKEQVVLQKQVAGTSAELAQLRSQINPHFLFNALNSLYAAAMKEKAEQTADGIQRLGDMMRFMLQDNNLERISVEKEITNLQNYIHLQRIRIDETQGIDIKVVLNEPDGNVYIAPMMLIPFVENAFKHGISHRSPSWIFITLSFDATHVFFRVQNSRHTRLKTDTEAYQSGIGLQNVQKRLNLLYPERHVLQIQESDHDYIAALTITI